MKIKKKNFPTHDILVRKIKEWEFQKKTSSTYFYRYLCTLYSTCFCPYTRKGKSTVALHFSHYRRISFLE